MFDQIQLHESNGSRSSLKRGARIACALFSLALSAGLAIAMLVSDKAPPEMAGLVFSELEKSGVENPVTAVLLNFRSYDTLLEVAVLFIVALAMLPMTSIAPGQKLVEVDREHSVDPALAGLLRWLVPLAAILGGYLLWVGAYAPGGAFQAGAVIAGAGVALKLSGRYRFVWQPAAARLLLCAGLAVFVLAGALCAGAATHVLEYPVEYAGLVILVIELAATVTIASVLLLLFTGLQDKMPSDAGRGRASN